VSPEQRAPYQRADEPALTLLVHGRTRVDPTELCRWIDGNVPIRVGDELRVRILDAEVPDPPERLSGSSQREDARARRRRLYEELKREFGNDHAAA
jgi:hypothetical protein